MKRAGCLALAIVLPLAAARAEERPRVHAGRASGPVHVDGRLDELAWGSAVPVSAFRLIDVREGEAPSESTEVRVLLGEGRIFFGIRCWNRGPGPVRASLAPRDKILDDDQVSIHLDTYLDRHRAYIFGVNPYSVQLDGILDGGEPDFNWDGVWEAECARDSAGWTAEMAIPLRSLRFASRAGAWGLWVRRQITKNDEVCSWPPWKKAVGGDIMLQAADLDGLDGIRGGGRAEIQPYAASTSSSVRAPVAGAGLSPWARAGDQQAGFDLKYGLTSTITMNLTANPDYSQVEADALQLDVNRRFPLFFPEKRPFFLEGAEIYNSPFQWVYTRRIADPAYGGKLTGKLGRWRLGAMALRDDGGGSTDGVGARSDGRPSRPGAFGVARVTYDVGENSSVGLFMTAHATDAPDGPQPAVLGARVPAATRNGMIAGDARLRLAKSLFCSGFLATSTSRADTLVDGGPRIEGRFSDVLSSGALWWRDGTRYALVYQDYLGDDFRDDAGFFERIGVHNTGYEANVVFRPENRWLRFVEPSTSGYVIRDTRGRLEERRLEGGLEWSFQGQTWAQTRVSHTDERWHSRLYDRRGYALKLGNSRWRPLTAEIDLALEDGIYYGDADSTSFLGWQERVELKATARPSPRVTSELSATRSRFLRERGGGEVYDIWLLGARTTYQFTRRLYARIYPQYDTGAGHLDLDGLLGYVIHPGSVLYLGLSDDLDKIGNRRRVTQRTVFLKASYLFQI